MKIKFDWERFGGTLKTLLALAEANADFADDRLESEKICLQDQVMLPIIQRLCDDWNELEERSVVHEAKSQKPQAKSQSQTLKPSNSQTLKPKGGEFI